MQIVDWATLNRDISPERWSFRSGSKLKMHATANNDDK